MVKGGTARGNTARQSERVSPQPEGQWAESNGGRDKVNHTVFERYLSHEEIQHLLNTCTGDVYDMALLALGTGMRASEVLGLERERVNMKDGVAILLDTKNGDRRIVPLPQRVIDMLT
jgi:integrase